jgi:hypothetical protein
MNERDMEYLGSINTSPGPNAGKSIDQTKPGPDAIAQSDAEPVAWQVRWTKKSGWSGWHEAVPTREQAELTAEVGRKLSGGDLDEYEIRPLYAAPPRPDASAGLIEAADYLIGRLRAALLGRSVRDLDEAIAAYESARARAADRIEK